MGIGRARRRGKPLRRSSMKIDLSAKIINIVTGKAVVRSVEGDPKGKLEELTLGHVLVEAYLSPHIDRRTGDDLLSAKEKVLRFKMATKIVENEGGTIELDVDELSKACDLVNRWSPVPQIVAQATALLNGFGDKE
jgi:hypothetical protein